MLRSAASIKVMWVWRARRLTFWFLAVLVAASIGVPFTAKPAYADTFTVNRTGDEPDAQTTDGICDVNLDTRGKQCTLRAAIEQANANTNQATTTDVVRFNIPQSLADPQTGVFTIAPGGEEGLPLIIDALKIDGYTQGDATADTSDDATENTLKRGTNARLLIELRGQNSLEGPPTGLKFGSSAASSVVKGLVINSFTNGVYIQNSSTTIAGNFIGTNPSGTQKLPNSSRGVRIEFGDGNTVGGTSLAARNLLSGNGRGVQLVGNSIDRPENNQVVGNLIGTDATGTRNLGNSFVGVEIQSAANNTVGGTTDRLANTIAFNGGAGVLVTGSLSSNNRILRNSIFSNTGLGIDLGADGSTANDEGAGDSDTGANNLQNFPVITLARNINGSMNIGVRLDSTPSQTFRFEFFSNPAATDEGKSFYTALSATDTDGDGVIAFTFNPGLTKAVAVGKEMTATATDANGNTSEISAPKTVTS